jgi:hypothetical protein
MPAKLPHTEPSRRSKKKVENFQRNQRATSTVGNPTVKVPAMLDMVASTEHPTTRSAINGESILCYINDVAACTRCHRADLGWPKFIRETSQIDDRILPVYDGSGPVVVVEFALLSRWCGPFHHVHGGSP